MNSKGISGYTQQLQARFKRYDLKQISLSPFLVLYPLSLLFSGYSNMVAARTRTTSFIFKILMRRRVCVNYCFISVQDQCDCLRLA